ncbi:hypothetical protein AALP_AA6G096800 [Arabis alpina]|uniref:Uncharacterized protein n=1 Tax=Arabis alpina TaxID=50452 RepID=A0A087GN63_ARAAL|nr:hypothetical protein AALP_AA6G096800 [Arabis alpina]
MSMVAPPHMYLSDPSSSSEYLQLKHLLGEFSISQPNKNPQLRSLSIDVAHGSRVFPQLLLSVNNLLSPETAFLALSPTLSSGCINVGLNYDYLALYRAFELGSQKKFLHESRRHGEQVSSPIVSIFLCTAILSVIVSPSSMSLVVIVNRLNVLSNISF